MTLLKDFPLPTETPLHLIQMLDAQARQLQEQSPSVVSTRMIPTVEAMELAREEAEQLRAKCIAHQEELDWQYYKIYGLIDEEMTFDGDVPSIALG